MFYEKKRSGVYLNLLFKKRNYFRKEDPESFLSLIFSHFVKPRKPRAMRH